MSVALKSLSELKSGERGLVRRLCGGKGFVNRMAAIGFTHGAEVVVVQNYGRGAVIVGVRGTRVALGRGEASKVLIETLPEAG